MADRERWGPWGLFGGKAGQRASYILIDGEEESELGSKVTIQLKPGQIISYRTCGGGGYGLPYQRNPELVLRDVREGKVNLARAREMYGVDIDTNGWTVNEIETTRLRQRNPTKGED